ncbi:MAG: LuxR C-terminal-related transcriptional regulator [Caulobacter sp.]
MGRLNDVLAAKFDPPIWIGDQIRRDPLLERLDAALKHRLTIIHAPAGYGKTSLLAQWRDSLPKTAVRTAWLTLERDDRDVKRLVRYLLLAVHGSDPNRLRKGHSGDLPLRAALSALLNDLGRGDQPFILILDDLHHADSEAVANFLQSMVRLAPANCHFVFASRDYPSLGQSVLAAEEQLLEIGAADLRFTDHEAETLLARAGRSLEADDIDKILERTEGWPIAVQLTGLSLKRGMPQDETMARFSGPSVELARYLSEQVFMTLPDETRQVVLETALLDRLTGELVNFLCDRADGGLLLEQLEQQGVFLTPVTPGREEYRYHQLFAEYLRDRLLRVNRDRYAELQRRAAHWFAMRDRIADAINHALLASDQMLVAELLEEAGGWRLIPRGLQGVVERGLAGLSKAVIAARPRLALAEVYLQIKVGELGLARASFDSFLASAPKDGFSADLQTEVQVVGDTLGDYENQPVTLEDLLAREALLRKLPANDHLVLANISETLGAKYFEGGWLERALQPTLAARDHYQAFGSVYSDLFTRFLESRIKRAQGRSIDAITILDQAWERILTNFGRQSDLAANCAAFQAVLLYEQNRADEARALLAWALPHMERSDGWVDVYAAAYLTEARALAGGGALDEALEVVERARRTAMRRRLRQLELLADVWKVELHLLYGTSLATTREKAEAIGLNALADGMTEDSPQYRPVAVAASLCRVRLLLQEGDEGPALDELRYLKTWAEQRGGGRLLIEVNILLAYGYRSIGAAADAKVAFDEAVGIAMFQNLSRPFLDASYFVQPLLEEALASGACIDRFRDQFLKSLSKSLPAMRSSGSSRGVLSDAESDVLHYLSLGHSNKEIARIIGMSPDTVKYRLKAVFRKIGVSKRRDAVRVSAERGLIPSP